MSRQELGTAYDARVELLKMLRDALQSSAENELEGVEHIDRISFRVKDRASFVHKAANPKYQNPLTDLEDQIAGRVITFFRDDLRTVRDRLTEWAGPVEHETKEPMSASEFDYESDHYVFVIPEHWKPKGWHEIAEMPTTFEMQVRTLFMHAWAEPQHDLGYKRSDGTGLDRDTKRELACIAASAWGADRMLNGLAKRVAASGPSGSTVSSSREEDR